MAEVGAVAAVAAAVVAGKVHLNRLDQTGQNSAGSGDLPPERQAAGRAQSLCAPGSTQRRKAISGNVLDFSGLRVKSTNASNAGAAYEHLGSI
jgi:hypothetical protein